MSLSSTFYGTPSTYGVGVTPSMRPPMFGFAKDLGAYLSSLIGQPMPQYPGQLDPGMSPTMQMLGKMVQQYAGSGAPPIMGAAANSLARFMNPSFTNPVARIGGGSPGYAPVNMQQPMFGGGAAGNLYNQWQVPPSYQLPQAPGAYPPGQFDNFDWSKGGAAGGGGFNQPFVGGNMGNDPNYFPQGNVQYPNVGVPYNGGQGGGATPMPYPRYAGNSGQGSMGGAMQPQYPGKPAPTPQGGNGWIAGTPGGGIPGWSNPNPTTPFQWTQEMMNNAVPMGKSPSGNYGW